MRSLRSHATIGIALVLAAACTQQAERDLPDVAIGTGSAGESPVTSPPASPSEAPVVPTNAGRLAILDSVGNLATIAPDGSDLVTLLEAEPGTTAAQQPTWSPDGSHLAWVSLESGDGSVTASLVTATPDGDEAAAVSMASAPFYLSWDPTSSRVAYLGPSAADGIELGIVDVAGGVEAPRVDAGQPFYLSWDPSGEHLLVHVGADRLDRLELDGTTATVHDRPGTFTAPVWTSDGRSFVFAAGQGNRQQLLRQDSEDGTARAIVRFGGTIGFVVSPDGGSVAFQVRGDDGTVNELSVVDLDTGATERLTDELALAFFWSPQGDKLLYLLPDPTPELVWFRWNVWDGGSSFSLPRWVPSTEFGRDYLGFFEQYAQSMSLWAPDGAAFAYAGTSETGEQGVFVQEARSGTEPIRVSQGVFASWSPA